MTLKCTVDGRPEEAPHHVIFVCHHCGRPVCEQHGLVVPADGAFDASGEEPDRTPQSGAHPARRPQAAMHCKQCTEKHHRGERAHPGWADPRDGPRSAQAQPRAAQPAVAGQQYPMQPQAPWPGQAGQQQPDQQQGRATGRP
jgi:hypothetical protein